VANPEVAEVLVISPRQVMINGLANGETSIIIWDTDGNYTMNSLVVGDQLQDQVMLEVTVTGCALERIAGRELRNRIR
jgi:Flp pilus assembly secretin CpaC